MVCRYYTKGFCGLEKTKTTIAKCKKCDWYVIEKQIKELEDENEKLRRETYEAHMKNAVNSGFVRLD